MPGFAGYSPSRRIGERVPTPNVSNTPKLHPLHTIERLVAQMQTTGSYPDPDRCTGRSTIIALTAIVEALKNPHKPITVRDHIDLHAQHREVIKTVWNFVQLLELKGFTCSETNLTVTYSTF